MSISTWTSTILRRNKFTRTENISDLGLLVDVKQRSTSYWLWFHIAMWLYVDCTWQRCFLDIWLWRRIVHIFSQIVLFIVHRIASPTSRRCSQWSSTTIQYNKNIRIPHSGRLLSRTRGTGSCQAGKGGYTLRVDREVTCIFRQRLKVCNVLDSLIVAGNSFKMVGAELAEHSSKTRTELFISQLYIVT